MASEPGSNANTWGQEFIQSKVLVAPLCSRKSRASARKTGRLGLIATRGTVAHAPGSSCSLLPGPWLGRQTEYLSLASCGPDFLRAEAGLKRQQVETAGFSWPEPGEWAWSLSPILLPGRRQSPDSKRGEHTSFLYGRRKKRCGTVSF